MWTKEHRARHEPRLRIWYRSGPRRRWPVGWNGLIHLAVRRPRPRWRLCERLPGICVWAAPGARLAAAPAAVAEGVWLVPTLAGPWPVRPPDVRGCGAAAAR